MFISWWNLVQTSRKWYNSRFPHLWCGPGVRMGEYFTVSSIRITYSLKAVVFCTSGCLSTLWCFLWKFGPACWPLLSKESESTACLPLLLLQVPLAWSCDFSGAQSHACVGTWFQVWNLRQFFLYTPATGAAHAICASSRHEPGAHLHLRSLWQTIPLPLALRSPLDYSFRYIVHTTWCGIVTRPPSFNWHNLVNVEFIWTGNAESACVNIPVICLLIKCSLLVAA